MKVKNGLLTVEIALYFVMVYATYKNFEFKVNSDFAFVVTLLINVAV